MYTYKSEHTGERVDNAVTKIPEGLPTEDSFIVVKANGSASGYVPQSQISSNKLDKQTAQTTSDQIYGKLADGSQTMFDLTMGAEPTTIPRRDTAGRVQVADGVSGNDAVNFKQLSAVESSVINSLDKEHIAYVNKENTFTEPQTFSYVHSDDPNWSEYAELGGGGANYSYTEYTDDTHKYSTSGEAYISSFVGRVMVGRSTIDEKGVSKNSIVLDVRKNWIARTEINAERVDGKLGTTVQTYYAYKFPKTYPNKEVTLATIEDLNAQLDTKFDKAGGTVTGDMVVGGNFTVQGRTTTVDSETLRVADKLIEVGKGNTAPLTSPAGLITPKYDGTNNGGIVYDHTGTAYVGDITLDSNGNVDVNNSDLQAIATRDTTITDGNIVEWDNTNKTLVDSGKTIDDLSTATNLENGEGQYSLIQKVAPSTTTDPNNYARGKEAVALGRYDKSYGDRSMTVNYDNENYGMWSFVANTKNKNGSKDVPQENVQSNAMFGCANEIKAGIEGFVAGNSNVNYEGDRFDISGSGNENYTNNVRMSGWKNKSLKEIKTPITSGGGGGGSTNPDTNPTEPTQPYDYTNNTGYADISGTENKVFAMGGRTRGVAGICYSPFGSTEGFWTKAGYLVEDTTKSTETEKYYKPQGLGAKAFGRATHAKEDFTVAGGEQSVALKKGANAIGYYTTANTEWGTAIGKYNVGKTNTLFEVGNGYAVFDAGRKNAFEVLEDGRAKVQTAPQDNDDVVRKLELDNLNARYVSTSILGG